MTLSLLLTLFSSSLGLCSQIQIQTLANMGETKVTVMVLKVDLQCSKCYRKVKKVLCKFPQIRDQVYDEKANTVTITVVCCSPEKIRDKLCSKGGGSIKSIEIKEPPKPKEPEKKPENPKEPEKKPEKPKEPEKKPDKPKEAAEKPKEPEKKPDKPKEADKPKAAPKEEEAPKKPPEPASAPALAPAPAAVVTAIPAAYAPMGCCCSGCYHVYGGGHCYQAYGGPIPYGQPVYDSWGGGGGCYQYKGAYGGCEYFTEENPQACSIM